MGSVTIRIRSCFRDCLLRTRPRKAACNREDRNRGVAEATQAKGSSNPIDPEAKFMRLQEVGLSHILAAPVAMMLAGMFGLERWYAHIGIALCMLGWVVFCLGLVGRQELAAKDTDEN